MHPPHGGETSNSALEALAYNCGMQTDIIITLLAKLQLSFSLTIEYLEITPRHQILSEIFLRSLDWIHTLYLIIHLLRDLYVLSQLVLELNAWLPLANQRMLQFSVRICVCRGNHRSRLPRRNPTNFTK